MEYVDTVRRFLKDYPLEEAVPLAVDYCIEHDILREFLLANKLEVISMSIFEYDEELHNKTLYEEGYDDCKKEMTKVIAEKNSALAEKDAEIKRLKEQLSELVS